MNENMILDEFRYNRLKSEIELLRIDIQRLHGNWDTKNLINELHLINIDMSNILNGKRGKFTDVEKERHSVIYRKVTDYLTEV